MRAWRLLPALLGVVSVHAAEWNYDSSVSDEHRSRLDKVFDEVVLLAKYGYEESMHGPGSPAYGRFWKRWFPDDEMYRVVSAMYGTFTRPPQIIPFKPKDAGMVFLKAVDFTTVTVKTTDTAFHIDEAWARMDGNSKCVMTINRSSLKKPLLAEVDKSKIRDNPTPIIESISSVVFHELMHCHQLTRDSLGRSPHNGNTDTRRKFEVVDMPSPDEKDYKGNTYGSYPCWKLNQCRPADSLRNADNYMYYALDAYWRHQPGMDGKLILAPKRDDYKKDCGFKLRLSDELVGNPESCEIM